MLSLLLSADSTHIGRMDASMLSDQQMVELFFTPESYNHARAILQGDEADVCSWVGISCTGGSVSRIFWPSGGSNPLIGSIDFGMIPRHLEMLSISRHRLYGKVQTQGLPETLEHFQLKDCKFSGTLDLGSLPRGIKVFRVMHNRISGLENIRNLPMSLTTVEISEHKVQQESIRIGEMPPNSLIIFLQGCRIREAEFEDDVDWQRVIL